MAKNRASLKMPEEKRQKCIQLLIEGKLSKREIANKLKINSGYVYRLAAESNVGQAKAEAKKAMQETTVVNEDINTEKVVDNLAEELEASITTPQEQIEESIEESEEDNDSTVKGKLTEEDKIKIGLECENNELTRTEIAKKWGVSQSTVSRIAKDMGIPTPPKTGISKPKKQGESTISTLNKRDIEEIFKGSHIICGLIAERHDIPCSEFIFDEALPSNMMHDYQFQYDTCKEFVESKITISKDGTRSADVICYMTGCQSVLGALVKTCFDLQINLTLMHYDTDVKDYHPQVIFDQFKDENIVRKVSYLAPFLEQYNKAFFYKCNEDDIKDLASFFVVNKVCIGNSTVYDKYTKKDAIQEVYICKNDGDAWLLYPKLAKEIMEDTSQNFCLYMIPVDQDDNVWTYNNAFAKTYNFKSDTKR